MHKPPAKKITCAKKEHDNNGKGKHHDKSKLWHERHHSLGNHHIGKRKNFFVITMVYATMTQMNSTLLKLAGNMYSCVLVPLPGPHILAPSSNKISI
eukprot:12676170-Ditylum_brightwellii.AAC.1